MEHPSQDQPNNLPPTQDKVPHGGERPDFELGPLNTGEVPRLVKELDARETVPDALVGRTKIEDTVDALAATTYESSVDTQPGKGLSRSAKIGAAVAAVFLTAVSVFGIGKALDNGGESNLPPEDEPVATAPVNPTGEASPNPVETSAPVESELSIPAGLDAESYGKKYVDIINAWTTAGSEDIENLRNEMLDGSGPQEVFWQNVAQKNTVLFAKALFGESWEDNPSVASFVDQMTKVNANYLQLLYMTKYGRDKSVDKEPYTRWAEFESVTEEKVDGATRKLTITYSNHNNADMNSVEDNQLPSEGKTTLTTKTNGVDEVITSAE